VIKTRRDKLKNFLKTFFLFFREIFLGRVIFKMPLKRREPIEQRNLREPRDPREPSAVVYSAVKEEAELKSEDYKHFLNFLKEKELLEELSKKFSKEEIGNAPKAFEKAQNNSKLEEREVELLATVLKHLKENVKKYGDKYSRVGIILIHKQLEDYLKE